MLDLAAIKARAAQRLHSATPANAANPANEGTTPPVPPPPISQLAKLAGLDKAARPDDLAAREAFHERAAILEFDAGLPRADAEQKALLMLDGVPISRRDAEALAHGLLPKNWRASR